MGSNAIPYFKTVKSFADVPITEAGVETTAFLDAADGLVNMFDLLGSRVFAFIQTDLRNNIHGVRARFFHAPAASTTLESLVEHENAHGLSDAAGCLLRLLRGLAFTRIALQNSRENNGEELPASFKRAYDTTLRHHHSFVVRAVVAVAIRACPRRQDFYSRIAQGGSQDALDEELGKWLLALGGILRRMGEFYETKEHGRL